MLEIVAIDKHTEAKNRRQQQFKCVRKEHGEGVRKGRTFEGPVASTSSPPSSCTAHPPLTIRTAGSLFDLTSNGLPKA